MSETVGQPRRAPKKGRSPSYPAIDLEAAIGRAEAVYRHEKMHPAPIGAIVGHWGYKSHTSGVASVQYAALKKFGLLDEEGSRDHRQGRLTDLAFAILHNPNADERLAAIQRAALMPPIHREMWEQYGASLPSDATLRYRLVTERGFTEAGADDFVRQYKSTIAFAMPEGSTVDEDEDQIPTMPSDDEDMGFVPARHSFAGSQPHTPTSPGAAGSNPRRLQTTDIWYSEGERVLVPAPEPPVTARTSRHAIPLIGGKQVVLEGEFPLTEEAWDGFMNILQAFKPGLVDAAPKPTSTPTPEEFMRSRAYDENDENDDLPPTSSS